MKGKKRIQEKVESDQGGAFKSVLVELNGQLQSYLNALKTTSSEQSPN